MEHGLGLHKPYIGYCARTHAIVGLAADTIRYTAYSNLYDRYVQETVEVEYMDYASC